jgi:hypothetical protein
MPKILTVSDIKGNFYGGLPYNVIWDFNDGSSPSTLSVSVVNENGVITQKYQIKSHQLDIPKRYFDFISKYMVKLCPTTYTDWRT